MKTMFTVRRALGVIAGTAYALLSVPAALAQIPTRKIENALLAGAGLDGNPHVISVIDSEGSKARSSFFAFPVAFRGGISVTGGDINGDKIDDIITGAGPGAGPHVKVFDGATGQLVRSFYAFDSRFSGGVELASGDVNGDGKDDIIVGAGPSGNPHVIVFDGVSNSVIHSFFAYSGNFFGGITVGSVDVDGDGKDDIITGAGLGGGPHVKVFKGTDASEIRSFYAFAPGFTGGISVAGGYIDEDDKGDIIVGAGSHGPPHVVVFSGANNKTLNSFYAFQQGYTGGIRVGATDKQKTGSTQVIVGARDGGKSHIVVFDASNGQQKTIKSFYGFANFQGPINVSGFSAPEAVTQCNDGIDNDKDGAIDLADFSCGGDSTRDDEATPIAQCQDGIDNDNNGVIDMNDTGCSSPQDNDESNGGSRLLLSAECVMENTDGTRTAYFTYNNKTPSEISSAFVSGFTQNATTSVNVTSFKPGECKGCVAATFTGDTVGWTVIGDTIGTTSTETNSRTPKCAPLQPLMACQGYTSGKIRIKSGWTNPNLFSVYFPVGALNSFTPGQENVGQPVAFTSGTMPAGFDATLPRGQKSATWTVNGTSVSSQNLKVCDGECVDTTTGSITGELNKIAKELADATRKAAKNLQAAAPEESADAERARRLATQYETEAATLTLGIPAVIKNCPEAPLFCETVNNGPTIDALIGLYAEARNTVKRVQSRAYFRKTGKTNRNDPLIRKAVSLENDGLQELAKLPRVAVECK